MLLAMADNNVTRILNAAAQGDPRAAGELVPLPDSNETAARK